MTCDRLVVLVGRREARRREIGNHERLMDEWSGERFEGSRGRPVRKINKKITLHNTNKTSVCFVDEKKGFSLLSLSLSAVLWL